MAHSHPHADIQSHSWALINLSKPGKNWVGVVRILVSLFKKNKKQLVGGGARL